MKRDHLTPPELAAYHQCRLPAADALLASDHVAECAECRARLLELGGSVRVAGSAEGTGELSYEDLAGWLDDELDPLTRREVADILARSPRARAELADLTAFRAEMNAAPAHDHSDSLAPRDAKVRPFARWMLPVAAAVVLGGAAIWWTTRSQPDAAHLITLRDGDRVIAFAQDGRSVALAALPGDVGGQVAGVIRSGRIELEPEVAEMIGRTGTLAGPEQAGSGLRVLEPVGTAVRDRRPRFRWSSESEAAAYQINVVEETSGALIVTEQLPPDTTEWQPPDPMAAGEAYQWEVQAVRDGTVIANSPRPPEPEARFRVLSPAKLAELEEIKRASAGSHLVMGVANARLGLIDEALREFRLLAEQNPGAELPRRLLAQLEAQRRPAR